MRLKNILDERYLILLAAFPSLLDIAHIFYHFCFYARAMKIKLPAVRALICHETDNARVYRHALWGFYIDPRYFINLKECRFVTDCPLVYIVP